MSATERRAHFAKCALSKDSRLNDPFGPLVIFRFPTARASVLITVGRNCGGGVAAEKLNRALRRSLAVWRGPNCLQTHAIIADYLSSSGRSRPRYRGPSVDLPRVRPAPDPTRFRRRFGASQRSSP